MKHKKVKKNHGKRRTTERNKHDLRGKARKEGREGVSESRDPLSTAGSVWRGVTPLLKTHLECPRKAVHSLPTYTHSGGACCFIVWLRKRGTFPSQKITKVVSDASTSFLIHVSSGSVYRASRWLLQSEREREREREERREKREIHIVT